MKRFAAAIPLAFEQQPARQRAAGVDYSRLADIGARAAIVVLFSFMVARQGSHFLETGRMTGLLLVISELLVVVLTFVRRSAATVDRSMRARVLTTLSMLAPPLLHPGHGAPLAPEILTVAVSIAGLAVVIAGKVSLGRSFGLMPANRGVVSTGLYRFVRHPIYMGYLITHVAFLVANPTIFNISMLAAGDAALLVRAMCEEQTLARDPAYQQYLKKVRWRVLPRVF
jgi:protein-S-isoprenylcysteine O-methyltransferase Ste14